MPDIVITVDELAAMKVTRERAMEIQYDNLPDVVEVATGVPGPVGPTGPTGPPGPEGQWVQVTQAEYDALTPDPDVLYIVVG